MGKRLYRIFGKDIPSGIQALKNSEISVVLKNNKTWLGLLADFGKEDLTLKDSRMIAHTFKFSEISEIIYDREAAY